MIDQRSMKPSDNPQKIQTILGFGLDHVDGHIRLTRGDDFTLMMGSQETHEEMAQVLTQVEKRAEEKGKSLSDLSKEDFQAIARELNQNGSLR